MLKTICNAYTNLFVVWVVLFGAIAYFLPEPFLAMKPGMNWFFAITMFGIGVVLEPDDFIRIGRHPVIILTGVISQYTLMPLGAYAISTAMGLPREIAAGLILTGAAPGAMSSNVLSYVAKADTAYSVSLTTASTLLCPLLTPGLTLLLAGAKMDVEFTKMMIDILWMVIVPLLAGFGVRRLAPERIGRILYIFPALSTTFIVFVCSVVIASNRGALIHITGAILLAALVLNAYGMAAGYGVGWLTRMNVSRRRTLSIEIGMQNAGLGAVLALKYFGDRAASPAALFVFVCIITASAMASYWRNRPIDETIAEGASA
ncbi:MAG: bile acid:sodium symporter [bacterium]|nr:bile acid:sodium symporter [bacterium]